MRSLTCIIITTNACNLRCKYCYHADLGYLSDALDLRQFARFINLVKESQIDSLSIIWHGGEPLLMPMSYYKEAVEIENAILGQNNCKNYIQTNGTLLTNELAEELKRYNFLISVSYDGESNDQYRGETSKTVEGIRIIKDVYGEVNTIKVVQKHDLSKLIDIYKYYSRNGCNLKLLPLEPCGLTDRGAEMYSPEEYSNALLALFDYVFKDSARKIMVNPLDEYISIAVDGNYRECTHSGCHYNYICLDTCGNMFPCARFASLIKPFANIDEIESLDEYYCSIGFVEMINSAINRKKQCSNYCKLYKYCYGGCSFDFYDYNLRGSNSFNCEVLKRVLPTVIAAYS